MRACAAAILAVVILCLPEPTRAWGLDVHGSSRSGPLQVSGRAEALLRQRRISSASTPSIPTCGDSLG